MARGRQDIRAAFAGRAQGRTLPTGVRVRVRVRPEDEVIDYALNEIYAAPQVSAQEHWHRTELYRGAPYDIETLNVLAEGWSALRGDTWSTQDEECCGDLPPRGAPCACCRQPVVEAPVTGVHHAPDGTWQRVHAACLPTGSAGFVRQRMDPLPWLQDAVQVHEAARASRCLESAVSAAECQQAVDEALAACARAGIYSDALAEYQADEYAAACARVDPVLPWADAVLRRHEILCDLAEDLSAARGAAWFSTTQPHGVACVACAELFDPLSTPRYYARVSDRQEWRMECVHRACQQVPVDGFDRWQDDDPAAWLVVRASD